MFLTFPVTLGLAAALAFANPASVEPAPIEPVPGELAAYSAASRTPSPEALAYLAELEYGAAAAANVTCPGLIGDLNQNGYVQGDPADVVLFNIAYQEQSEKADLNKDDNIDWADVVLITHFFHTGAVTPVDHTLNGVVDITDLSEFGLDWSAGDPRADKNCDGVVDIADLSLYTNWFTAGCP